MLTPFGLRLLTGALALLLLGALLYLFVLGGQGRDFLCDQAGLCLSVGREP